MASTRKNSSGRGQGHSEFDQSPSGDFGTSTPRKPAGGNRKSGVASSKAGSASRGGPAKSGTAKSGSSRGSSAPKSASGSGAARPPLDLTSKNLKGKKRRPRFGRAQVGMTLLALAAVGGGLFLSLPAGQPTLQKLTQLTNVTQKTALAQINSAQRKVQAIAAPEPTAPQLSRYETMLCNMVNRERKKRGLSMLQITPALAEVARGHSREMAQKGYFAHESPTKGRKNPIDRYKLKYKRSPRLIAENIYMLKAGITRGLTEEDFRKAHEGWMKSPGHRANILRTSPVNPTQIGVGIVVKNGSFWATQNFATPL